MRHLIAAALVACVGFPGIALAVPQAGSGGPPTINQRLAQCDKIKTPAARQDCRKKVLATRPPAHKPPQTVQRKPAPKKPVTPAASTAAPAASSTM